MSTHCNSWGNLTWDKQVMETLLATQQKAGDLIIACGNRLFQGKLLSFDNGLVALQVGDTVVTVDMDSINEWQCLIGNTIPRFNAVNAIAVGHAPCDITIDSNPTLTDYGDPSDLAPHHTTTD